MSIDVFDFSGKKKLGSGLCIDLYYKMSLITVLRKFKLELA